MAFALHCRARHSLVPAHRTGHLTTRQASLHVTDRSVARPQDRGARRWASTPPVSRRSRQPATGPPGSYPDRTHTGKRRRADNKRSTTYTVNFLSTGRTNNLHCLHVFLTPIALRNARSTMRTSSGDDHALRLVTRRERVSRRLLPQWRPRQVLAAPRADPRTEATTPG